MSWLFSRALVAEYSAENFSDGEQYVPLSGMNMPEMFLSHGKTTEHSILSRFGMMCKPLTDDLGEELLKSLLADSRAKISAQQEKAQGSTGSEAVCGVKWRELSARFCPISYGWKTHRCLWEEDLHESLVTLPRWGMTVNGVLLERTTPVQGIKETGYGYEPNGNDFHHTPNTTGLDGGSNSRNALKKRQSFWRTPDCANGGTVSEDALCDMADGNMIRASGQAKQLRLQDQVRHPDLFPTPQQSDYKNKKTSKKWEKQGKINFSLGNPDVLKMWPTITQHGNYNRKGLTKNSGDGLATAVRMWGTPKCQDERAATTDRGKSNLGEEVHGDSDISNGERLNPDWVEWLMGWPIGYTRLSPITAEILSWDEDPADYGSIPRVTNEKLHRSERIKRIGNGQCPQALVLAYLILSKDDIPKKQKQYLEEAA